MAARRIRTAPRRAPQQKRSEDTVSVLVEATERVLAKRGYAGTTTNRIATEAGVSIGTVYHYFPTKESLLEAVVHRMWEQELAVLEGLRHLLTTLPPREAIPTAVSAFVAFMASRQTVYERWHADIAHLGQTDGALALTEKAVNILVESLEAHPQLTRRKNLRFACNVALKGSLQVVRWSARDHKEEVASGELAEELSDMLVRYLLVDV